MEDVAEFSYEAFRLIAAFAMLAMGGCYRVAEELLNVDEVIFYKSLCRVNTIMNIEIHIDHLVVLKEFIKNNNENNWIFIFLLSRPVVSTINY